uniref:Uncharacterized protein n=1 Tax=Boodleopsis pusilla TaxID=381415 RepID=A0A386AZE8_9CHLO|nr:hypothetical protein [Boodleopsis pusilla]AYC64819.1 hypothetical protein [Boodleopsis pusilla]
MASGRGFSLSNWRHPSIIKAPRYSILEGPPSGGGGANWNGGGGGGSGGGTGSNGFGGGGSHNYILIIICGTMVIIVGKVIVEWGYRLLNYGLSGMTQDYLEKTRGLPNKAQGQNRQARVKAVLNATTPLLLSGASLFVMSYIFTAERVREILRSYLAVIEVLAQTFGRALGAALPPQLRETAQRLGHVMAVFGAQIRWLVENVLIRILLWCRTAGILLCSAYLFLKIFSGAAELYKLFEPQGQQVLKSTGSQPVLLFCIGLLKSASVFIIAFLPKNFVLVGSGVLIGALALPGVYYEPLATFVLSYPTFAKVVSCVAGRWCCIIFVGYMANTATLRRFLPFFVGAGYLFGVYQLAMTATPNLLPITPS